MKNSCLIIFCIGSLFGSLQSCYTYVDKRFDKLALNKTQQDSLIHYDSTFKEIMYSLSSMTGDPIYQMGVNINDDSTFFLGNCLDGVFYIPVEECKAYDLLTYGQREELHRFVKWCQQNGITGGGYHQTLQQFTYLLDVDYKEYEDTRWIGVNLDTTGISKTVVEILDHNESILLLKNKR